nr:hypothetical protein Itr_chr14CG02760 [Ipomoea trifida]
MGAKPARRFKRIYGDNLSELVRQLA